MSEPLRLDDDYLLVSGTELERLSGGEPFWQRVFSDDAFRDRVGAGWLVAAFDAAAHWDTWEMHPHADEVVHVTGGRLVVTIDHDGEHNRITANGGETVIVPAGAWHTMDVVEAGGTLNFTYGRGTEHRPR